MAEGGNNSNDELSSLDSSSTDNLTVLTIGDEGSITVDLENSNTLDEELTTRDDSQPRYDPGDIDRTHEIKGVPAELDCLMDAAVKVVKAYKDERNVLDNIIADVDRYLNEKILPKCADGEQGMLIEQRAILAYLLVSTTDYYSRCMGEYKDKVWQLLEKEFLQKVRDVKKGSLLVLVEIINDEELSFLLPKLRLIAKKVKELSLEELDTALRKTTGIPKNVSDLLQAIAARVRIQISLRLPEMLAAGRKPLADVNVLEFTMQSKVCPLNTPTLKQQQSQASKQEFQLQFEHMPKTLQALKELFDGSADNDLQSIQDGVEKAEQSKTHPTEKEIEKVDTSWISSAEPVRIITFPKDIHKETIEFVWSDLEKILTTSKINKNLPAFIVSITGVYRSGKSFTINLMKMYLDYYMKFETDVDWELTNELPIDGGDWKRGGTSITHGIWMWNKPFIVNGVAIFLVDCQGTGDTSKSNPTLDNLILFLGFQLANVQILNIQSRLQTGDLERLYLCGEYANIDTSEEEGGGVLFDTLLFLLRNWEDDDNFGERKDEFENKIKLAETKTLKQSGDGIRKAFRHVTTYALPHPGRRVARSSAEDKLTLGDVELQHLVAVKELFRDVFIEMPKKEGARRVIDVRRLFQALEKRTINNKAGTMRIKTVGDALGEAVIYQAYIDVQRYYDSEMKKLKEEAFDEEDDGAAIKKRLESIIAETERRFEEKHSLRKYKDYETMKEYTQLIQNRRENTEEKIHFIRDSQELLKRIERLETEAKKYKKQEQKARQRHKEERQKESEERDNREKEREKKQNESEARLTDKLEQLQLHNADENKKLEGQQQELEDLKKKCNIQREDLAKLQQKLKASEDKEVINPTSEWTKENSKIESSLGPRSIWQQY